MATPVVALVADGAYYDVHRLERMWRLDSAQLGGDFHTRVVGARAAGIDEVDARLRAGKPPTEARLVASDALPLAPCDPDRAAYIQLDTSDDEPRFHYRDSRALVGHDQPIAADVSIVYASVGLLIADDLWRASPEEAKHAPIGFSAMLCWPGLVSHFGHELVVPARLRDIARTELKIDSAGTISKALPAWRFAPQEMLSYLSHKVHLRAGDVVGMPPVATLQRPGKVTVTLKHATRLVGWAKAPPAMMPWRR